MPETVVAITLGWVVSLFFVHRLITGYWWSHW